MRIKRLKIRGAASAGVLAVSFLVAAGASAEGQGGDEQRPRAITLQTGEQSVRATPGSFCLQQEPEGDGPGVAVCGDAAYPLQTKGRLELKPGQRFALRMHDSEVKRINLYLLKVKGQGAGSVGRQFHAKQRPGHPSRWVAKLPETANGKANTIDLGVFYKHGIGSADNWAGVRISD